MSLFAALAIVAAASPAACAQPEEKAAQPTSETPAASSDSPEPAIGFVNLLKQAGKAIERLANPRTSMLVRVVDTQGKPIEHARLQVSPSSGTDGAPDWREPLLCVLLRVSITGPDGTARVARPPDDNDGLQLKVLANGFVPMVAEWNWGNVDGRYDPFPREYCFKLERAQRIGGVVRDEKGQPIAGATVVLGLGRADYPTERPQLDINDHQEMTDSRGRWHCNHAPRRLTGISIRVECNGNSDIADFVPGTSAPAGDKLPDLFLSDAECVRQLPDLRAQKAVFVMKQGLVLTGRVMDANGKPVASAELTVAQTQHTETLGSFTQQENVWTDGNGTFRLANRSPGPSLIGVAAPGLVSKQCDIEIKAGMKPVEFRLSRGPVLKMLVVDAAGKPVAGAHIKPSSACFNERHHPLLAGPDTDGNGRWRSISSPEGSIPLDISKSGYATVHRTLVANGHECRVVLRQPVRIVGRVLDATTKRAIRKILVSAETQPLSPERERLHKVLWAFGIDAGSGDGYTCPAVTVDSQGRYQVCFNDTNGIDGVAWQICLQAPGYVTQRSRVFMTRDGAQTIDIEMHRGAGARGIVKRPDGTPVAGARVFLSTVSEPRLVSNGRLSSFCSNSLAAERTAADGRFELPIPTEPYVVGVLDDFGGAEITARELDARGDIVLQPWARVQGVVPKTVGSDGVFTESVSLRRDLSDDASKEEHTGCRTLEWLAERVLPRQLQSSLFGVSFRLVGREGCPDIDWDYSTKPDESRQFVFDRVLPGKFSVGLFGSFVWLNGKCVSPWQTGSVEIGPSETVRVETAKQGRAVVGKVVLPPLARDKLAATTGQGLLLFQRPLPANPSRALARVSKPPLDRAGGVRVVQPTPNIGLPVAADGSFKTDGVPPGVYRLLIEVRENDHEPNTLGNTVAWLSQEVTVPEPVAAHEGPAALGAFTLSVDVARLFRDGVAPDFHFTTADGGTHRLSEYRAENVVLHFTDKWASWPCDDPEALALLVQKRVGGKPLVWINVTGDSTPPPPAPALPTHDFKYVQAFLPPGVSVLKPYDACHERTLPHVIFVARDQKVTRK
ncbi:MAG: carboxypeptidase regulatory-like domain-containing protein [Planctomycetaceae bacterium]|nr:carboxypeptidase regulatory-like domain-containing protein [Planctomycetaceae bacterium]